MHDHPASKQQYGTGQPVQHTVVPSSSQRLTRRRASFRQRFWTRTSANYSRDNDDSASTSYQELQPTKSAYVPVNAASGFSRTVAATAAARDPPPPPPAPPPRCGNLAVMREQQHEDEEQSPNTAAVAQAQAHPPPPSPETDHHHHDLRAEIETDDYAAFIAAAEAEDRARRAERRGSPSRSKLRDSGYCSSSGGGLHREPYSPCPPAPTASRTLRRQNSVRAFGQRITEYIRPTRTDSVMGSRRVIRELHGE